IEVKSESLQSLLAGGIAFETPDLKAPVERKIPRFNLYKDRDQAFLSGQTLRLSVARGDGLKVGTPIRFRGLEMGRVESIELADDLQGVVLHARINQADKRIAARGAQFWLVKPELGLVRTANLETLVTGQYLEVQPAPVGAPAQYEFTLLEQAPGMGAREQGLKLV